LVRYKLNPEYGAVPTLAETTLLSCCATGDHCADHLTLMFRGLAKSGWEYRALLGFCWVLGLAIGLRSKRWCRDIITARVHPVRNVINVAM